MQNSSTENHNILLEKLSLVRESKTDKDLRSMGFKLASQKDQDLIKKTSATNKIYGTEFSYEGSKYHAIAVIRKKDKTLFPSFLVKVGKIKSGGGLEEFALLNIGGNTEETLKKLKESELKKAIDIVTKVALRKA